LPPLLCGAVAPSASARQCPISLHEWLPLGIHGQCFTLVGYTTDPTSATPIEGVKRTSAGFSYLGKLTADAQSQAVGVSGDGSVIVGFEDPASWKWTAAGGIQPLPQSSTWSSAAATAVSRDGVTIVGIANLTAGGSHAVRWTGTTYTDDGAGTYRAVNADGTVVGGSDGSGVVTVRVNGVSQALTAQLGNTSDLSGWTLTQLSGISDDGKSLCGDGMHNGVQEGWVAHLP
jgi:uncharacterized membrane protein